MHDVAEVAGIADTCIDKDSARDLSNSARKCWNAILEKNIDAFGEAVRESFDAQVKMFPNMVNSDVMDQIEAYRHNIKGWKLCGAGGGGYLVFISEEPIKNTIQIRIRR